MCPSTGSSSSWPTPSTGSPRSSGSAWRTWWCPCGTVPRSPACSVSTRGCPSPPGPSTAAWSCPTASRSSGTPSSGAAPPRRRWWSRCASPSSTRWRTTSASTTTGWTSWAGPERRAREAVAPLRYAPAVAFPRRLLNEGEEVILDLRPHWSFFLGRALVLLLAVAALVAVAVIGVADWLLLVVGAVVLVALARVVTRYAVWTTSEFVVTTDRLVLRSGVVSKRGIEIPLERVNTVFFSQRLRERLLRYGDLVVESGGERGRQVIADVPHPERVQSVIHGAMEDEEDVRDGVRPAPA